MKKLLLIFTFLLWLPFAHASQTELDRAYEAYKLYDYQTALPIFKTLAEQGNAKAQYFLAVMYDTRDGRDIQNYEEALNEAFKWYSKSAEQGVAEAQYKLAVMYGYGRGVSKNFTERFKWLSKAAEQGHAEAQYFLGRAYYSIRIPSLGEVVPQDYQKALKWYKKSAKQGYAKAQYDLAAMYYKGKALPKNYSIAFKWYSKLAQKGDAKAQYKLARMYYFGEGFPKNYIKSYMWVYIAEANGNERAEDGLQVLEKEMDSASIIEAKELAVQCLESNYQNCGDDNVLNIKIVGIILLAVFGLIVIFKFFRKK